jgi:ribosome-interacting GTPase 1
MSQIDIHKLMNDLEDVNIDGKVLGGYNINGTVKFNEKANKNDVYSWLKSAGIDPYDITVKGSNFNCKA